MTKKIVWRLANRPTPTELSELVKNGLMTKDEAREVLFKVEDEDDRTADSLKSEIKFLRELVERLSQSRSSIVETIKYVQTPYLGAAWYTPYQTWCTAGAASTSATYTTTTGSSLNDSILITGGASNLSMNAVQSFNDIQSF